jgi:hypothetical protein
VVVTEIEQDTIAGDYVRDIRIFGAPATEGGTGPMLVQLRIRSITSESLELSAPCVAH